MAEIKNIIFDFGGVLLDIDYILTYKRMEEVLGLPIHTETLPEATKEMLRDYEKGLTTSDAMISHLRDLSPNRPSAKDIVIAWNTMLMGWNPEKFALLEKLRKLYRVYLLSNTNELHLEWVHEDLKKHHGIADFETRFFDKVYYSHEIHLRKPDAEIYNFVTQDARLEPLETIFIDDLKPNIEAARLAGWNTYHHNPKDDIAGVMASILGLKL